MTTNAKTYWQDVEDLFVRCGIKGGEDSGDGGSESSGGFRWIDWSEFRRFFEDNRFQDQPDDQPDDPAEDPVAERPADPEPEPEADPEPEPEAELEPEPEQEPEPEPEPEPEAEADPDPEPEQSADPEQNAGSGSDGFGAFEREVIRLTNEARAENGLEALTADDRLNRAAEGHSDDMAKLDFFSHTGQDGSSAGDRMEDEGYDWRTWGENIAAGQDTPQQVVDGWLNSPGHRANILNANFEDIGVGFVEEENDTYGEYWTQVFAA